MIWLHGEIAREGDAYFGAASRRLESKLWEWARKLYPSATLPPTLQMFALVAERRRGPEPPQKPGDQRMSQPDLLRWLETWDKRTRRKREERTSPPPELDDLENAVAWAQERLLRRLAENGVILEFNPSSNWRVSRSDNTQDIPYIAILDRMKQHVLATVNTDNPGVFATRIENEYAIILDGLMQPRPDGSSMPRGQAIAVLERMRRIGLDKVYWPRSAEAVRKRSNQPRGYRWPGASIA